MVVPFLDPETGATNQALRINSGTNSTEWYAGPVLLGEIVAAARFKTVSFSGTGSENLLCVNVGGSMDPAASPAITIVTNRYKVWSYTEGAFGSGVGGSEILDIGPVIADELHTAYISLQFHGPPVSQLWQQSLCVGEHGLGDFQQYGQRRALDGSHLASW